jgi:hypothetical protein
MQEDRSSKPKIGRHFALSKADALAKINEFEFRTVANYYWVAKVDAEPADVRKQSPRIALFFVNDESSSEYGLLLASFSRRYYLTVFSLPDLVPQVAARAALERALTEFAVVDKQPDRRTKEQQFIVYRAYFRPADQLTITEDVINAGARWYLHYRQAARPSSLGGLKHVETVISQKQLGYQVNSVDGKF